MAARTTERILSGQFDEKLAARLLDGFAPALFDAKKLAATGEVLFLRAVGQQSEVANADQPVWQHVKQETADERIGIEGHEFELVVVFSITVGEGDATLAHREEAVVGDGAPMSVAAEVIEDLLGRAEGRFGVDNPFLLGERFEPAGEGARVRQIGRSAGKQETVLGEGSVEQVEKLPSEDDAERFDGEEEVLGSRGPARAIHRQRASGDQAMKMEGVAARLVPGVKNADETNFASEVSAAKLQQGLRNSLEQDVTESLLVSRSVFLLFCSVT